MGAEPRRRPGMGARGACAISPETSWVDRRADAHAARPKRSSRSCARQRTRLTATAGISAGRHQSGRRRHARCAPTGADHLSLAPQLAGWESPSVIPAIRDALVAPVVFENDVNMAAVGEHVHGVGSRTATTSCCSRSAPASASGSSSTARCAAAPRVSPARSDSSDSTSMPRSRRCASRDVGDGRL